jgi:hypothetical protein
MQSVRTAAAIAALVTSGCVVEHRIVVTGHVVHKDLATLRARGEAIVEATELRDGHAYVARERIRMDQPLLVGDKRLRVSELARDCSDIPPFPEDHLSGHDCELVHQRTAELEVRRFETRSVRPVVQGALAVIVLGALVASVACAAGCTEGSRLEEDSELTLGGLGVLALGGIVWAIVSCVGHGGEPGCRD